MDPLRARVEGALGQRRMEAEPRAFLPETNSCSESAHSLQEGSGPSGGR